MEAKDDDVTAAQDIPDVGPHEGRELELMLAGTKPLAMFIEVLPAEAGLIPEAAFAPHVRSGRLVMREIITPASGVPDCPEGLSVRHVLYALPEEAWRIEAMLLVCGVAASIRRWDEGLERVTGKLLGYEDWQIDAFLRKVLPKTGA